MAKILFLGDFFYDYEDIKEDIEDIAKYINSNNYQVILNLEGALVKNDNAIKKRGPNLSHSKITLELLKKMNVIGVTISNNHMYDYGKQGLEETIKMLKDNKIKYCGAGMNIKEATEPMQFIIDKKKIKIYNFGWNIEETYYAKKNEPGCSPRKENVIMKSIKKEDNEFLISIMHWGFEYNLYPQPYDIELAHKLIDNKSVDLIIGHHPHNIQSREVYKGKEIYYSLGNFYFASRRNRFSDILFNTQVENRCDYGMGLILDTDSMKIVNKIVFVYNKEKCKTEILEDEQLVNILSTDISSIINSKEYISLAKKNKRNKTPILTTNSLTNVIKLLFLYIWYFQYRMCVKYSFIRKIKDQVKKFLK